MKHFGAGKYPESTKEQRPSGIRRAKVEEVVYQFRRDQTAGPPTLGLMPLVHQCTPQGWSLLILGYRLIIWFLNRLLPFGVCPKAQLPTYRIRFRGSPELSKQLMPFPEDEPFGDISASCAASTHCGGRDGDLLEYPRSIKTTAATKIPMLCSLPGYTEGEPARCGCESLGG